jgi:hypothetical protein
MFKARRPCDTGQLHAIPLGDGLRGRIIIRWRRAPTIESVSLLVAIGVNNEGSREIPGICEGAKEDKAGWSVACPVMAAIHARCSLPLLRAMIESPAFVQKKEFCSPQYRHLPNSAA